MIENPNARDVKTGLQHPTYSKWKGESYSECCFDDGV
jgi:hypothetical protein